MREDGPPLDRCYYVKGRDEMGEWIFIPACYGGAIDGPESCTCDIAGSPLEQAQAARRSAEAEIERLREKAFERVLRIQEMFSQNARLRQRIRELEARP